MPNECQILNVIVIHIGYQGEPMRKLEFLTRTLGSITVILGGLFLLTKKLK